MRRALRIAARDRGEAALRLETGAFLVILCGQRLTAQPLRHSLVEKLRKWTPPPA
jgi:hypothetical protein